MCPRYAFSTFDKWTAQFRISDKRASPPSGGENPFRIIFYLYAASTYF